MNYGSEVCMKFSNEELWEYLITKFEKNPDVTIKILSDDDREVEITSRTPIQFICFDGEKQDYMRGIYAISHMLRYYLYLLKLFRALLVQ